MARGITYVGNADGEKLKPKKYSVLVGKFIVDLKVCSRHDFISMREYLPKFCYRKIRNRMKMQSHRASKAVKEEEEAEETPQRLEAKAIAKERLAKEMVKYSVIKPPVEVPDQVAVGIIEEK